MQVRTLKNRILLSHLAIILLLGFSISVLGLYQRKINILARAQEQVTHDLKVAHTVYFGQLQNIQEIFRLVSLDKDEKIIKELTGLDYVRIVKSDDQFKIKSEIAQEALRTGKEVSGTRILGKEELISLGEQFYKQAEIGIRFTAKAEPTTKKVIDRALAMEYAMPIYERGNLSKLLYAGRILNRDFEIVDRIRDYVFGNKMYKSKPVGTVTIFLDDTRISTNVLDSNGQRAIGTRVSRTVYDNVVRKGQTWLDRAFVVTNWYFAGYEPIRNIHGKIIGILYVGLLEQPFVDLLWSISIIFLGIILLVAGLAVVFSYILASRVSRPLVDVVEATHKVSSGNLGYRAKIDANIGELNELAQSFNNMASKLQEREENLRVSNTKLEILNKSYLDLIGFVAHELKGMLSSVILNAYSVRDGFLGMINFKQRKAMDLVTRKLDYLSATVKNFLSLSRIEKGELAVRPQELLIKEDVFSQAIEEFTQAAAAKQMEIVNNLQAGIKAYGDLDLLVVVANNLIGNAVKYGMIGGKIIIGATEHPESLEFSVYNDGQPLSAPQQLQLFKRFSRLASEQTKAIQGTGLGLFITKEIIQKHGGHIWVESSMAGNSFHFDIERAPASNYSAG
ncbi:MAG: cache domain-containing protein [Candidatus Omnitrophota bacterium]